MTAPEAGMSPSEGVQRMEFMLMLRRRGVTNQAVLRAMDEVPREHFVEQRFADSAYTDHALPIACGQTISQPYVVAVMTEALDVKPNHRVLEVGTGSGYQAAVLSRLAREVVSIERYRTLAEAARSRLKTSDLKPETRVKEIIPVNLARPRGLAIKDDPDFVRLRRHIWDLLEKEVQGQVGNRGTGA